MPMITHEDSREAEVEDDAEGVEEAAAGEGDVGAGFLGDGAGAGGGACEGRAVFFCGGEGWFGGF